MVFPARLIAVREERAMPLLLPAIQAAREAAAVELNGEETLVVFLGGSPNVPSDLGEFVYGIAHDTVGTQAAPPPRPLPAPILTGGKERQDDIIDVIVSLPSPPDEPVSGWLFNA
jgi:hypothetical protein